MKRVMNTYNKRLTFPLLDFSIESGEIKIVSESVFMDLIPNPYLTEIIHEAQKKKGEKDGIKKRRIKVEKLT